MPSHRPIALITGASAGIGAAFARQLAADGYDLILVARRTERLDRLAAEIRARHAVCIDAMTADLTLDADVDLVCGRLEATDRLGLLVNNAGFGTRGLFFECDPGASEAMHRLHVLATERLTRAALPGMVARGAGAVINVASVAGFLQGSGNASYCATKAWMISFTEGIDLELRGIGSPVQVQALCPGYTLTEFHERLGVDRSQISQRWMHAEVVVQESLLGLRRGKAMVIPGLRHRLIVKFATFLRQIVLKAAYSARSDQLTR